MPDFYQGTELWDFSLVDPDNRRPVDFALRQRLLDEIEDVLRLPASERTQAVASLTEHWEDGRIKLLLTAVGLRLRRDDAALFASGAYLPLVTHSAVPADIVAFARIRETRAALFIAPRLTAPLAASSHTLPLGGEAWKTSRILLPPELAGRTFTNLLTGESIRPTTTDQETWLFAGQLMAHVPVAILTADQ